MAHPWKYHFSFRCSWQLQPTTRGAVGTEAWRYRKREGSWNIVFMCNYSPNFPSGAWDQGTRNKVIRKEGQSVCSPEVCASGTCKRMWYKLWSDKCSLAIAAGYTRCLDTHLGLLAKKDCLLTMKLILLPRASNSNMFIKVFPSVSRNGTCQGWGQLGVGWGARDGWLLQRKGFISQDIDCTFPEHCPLSFHLMFGVLDLKPFQMDTVSRCIFRVLLGKHLKCFQVMC